MTADDCPHCGCTPRTRQTARQWIGLDLPDDPGSEPVYRNETPFEVAAQVAICLLCIAGFILILNIF